MPKYLRLILLVLLICFLYGCSGGQTRYFEKDGLSCIKAVNATKLYNPNSNSLACDGMAPEHFTFQSFEEMRSDVMSGNFSNNELYMIGKATYHNGCYSFPINIDSPSCPVLPNQWGLTLAEIQVSTSYYKLVYSSDPTKYDVYTDPVVVYTVWADAESKLNDFLEKCSTDQSENRKNYSLTDAGKQLYVTEYEATSGAWSFNVFGSANGEIFQIQFYRVNEAPNHCPTREELLQIDIQYLDLKS